MSFFGKQYKKVKAENVAAVIGKLNLSVKTLSMLHQQDSLTTFTQNDDGSLQYVVKASDGKILLDQNIELHKHKDFKAPDGKDTQGKYVLEGDSLLSHMHLDDGTVIYLDRYFEGNTMRLELYLKGDPEKAKIYFEAV